MLSHARFLTIALLVVALAGCAGDDLNDTTAADAVDPAAVETVTEVVTEVVTETASEELAGDAAEVEGERDVEGDVTAAAGVEGDGAVDASPAGAALTLAGFEMTVTGVDRLDPGAALAYDDYGSATSKQPQGQWVVVDVEYLNAGQAPVNVGSAFDSIRLLTFADQGGEIDGQYNPDDAATSGLTYEASEASIYDDVNPGSTLVMRHAYDMPADVTAEAIGWLGVENGEGAILLPAAE